MREVKRTITLECADVFSSVQSHFLFCFWIHAASAPSTAGTHTDGGAVIRKCLARRHLFVFLV